jgi:hypothetical protein
MVGKWLLQVEETGVQLTLPLGEFPDQGPGSETRQIRTIEQLAHIEGRYRLELTETGDYVETRPDEECSLFQSRGVRKISTDLSGRFLKRRGCPGGAIVQRARSDFSGSDT